MSFVLLFSHSFTYYEAHKSHIDLEIYPFPTAREDSVTLPCVGLLLTVSFLSLPLLSPSLAAGISLTFAIGLARSLARPPSESEGGMDCSRGLLLLGRLAVLCITQLYKNLKNPLIF